MLAYLARRLAQMLVVVLMVSIASFGLLFLTGDPTELLLGSAADVMSQEQIDAYRRARGFDRPWPVQYVQFLGRAVRGDFGQSMSMGEPVSRLVLGRLPATLELAFASLVLGLVVAIPIGIVSAARRNSWVDHGAMLAALAGISLPGFWLGILLILLFSVALGWLPVSGRIDFAVRVPSVTGLLLVNTLLAGSLAAFFSALLHLAMPSIALGTRVGGIVSRVTRSSVLELVGQDFVRTAHAKGLRERVVLVRHVLRNAAIPILTMIGLQLGFLLSTTIVVETVFSWPGMASLLVQALNRRDYALVQGVVFFFAVAFVLINLVVDLLYGLADPRVRVHG